MLTRGYDIAGQLGKDLFAKLSEMQFSLLSKGASNMGGYSKPFNQTTPAGSV